MSRDERERSEGMPVADAEAGERLFEETSDGVVTFDAEWRITSLNPAAERINGVRREEVVGRVFWREFPDVLGTDIEREFRRAAAERAPAEFEAFYPKGERWFRFRVRPDPGGGLWMLQRDVTARRRNDAILQRRGAEMEAVLESMPDAVYMGDERGITRSNRLGWEMLGFASAEELKKSIRRLAERLDVRRADTGERVPVSDLVFSRALRGESAVDVVRIRRISDGEERVVRSAAAPIRESGEIIGAVAINTDVTRRYRDEEALRASEERFRMLVESAREYAIFTTDVDGRITGWNTGAERLFGWREEEILGSPAAFVFLEEDGREGIPARELGRAAEEGRSVNERWHRRRDGSRFWGSGLVMPIRDRSGVLVGFTKIIQDRTEYRINEERLEAAKDAAEAASRAKDHLLATLSHELRTPLTPVVGAVEALRARPDLPDEVGETLEMIRRNVELEAKLIDDLLDTTRIARGKLDIVRGRVDLRQVVDDALQTSLAREADPTRLSIERETKGAPLFVVGDAARLTQVFWNLVNNSVKFTPSGGKIRVETFRRGGEIVVEITDTGIGIPSERLLSIFGAFEQGSEAITREFGGLGLGLAISRTIVEAHGGRLSAASEGPGKGARFTAIFPAAPDLAEAPSGPEAAPAAVSARRPLHVLLVEDHADSATALKALLELMGHRVALAGGINEAEQQAGAAYASGASFDLVVSDLGLPDGSGFTLMSGLARHYGVKGLALSGFAMEEDVRRSLEAGFSAHLTKPVNARRLAQAIDRVMEE